MDLPGMASDWPEEIDFRAAGWELEPVDPQQARAVLDAILTDKPGPNTPLVTRMLEAVYPLRPEKVCPLSF